MLKKFDLLQMKGKKLSIEGCALQPLLVLTDKLGHPLHDASGLIIEIMIALFRLFFILASFAAV